MDVLGVVNVHVFLSGITKNVLSVKQGALRGIVKNVCYVNVVP